MRSTVIIYKRGAGYVSDTRGQFGGGHSGVRGGLTAEDAAVTAARLMLRYASDNPEGGELIAPPEVMSLVPEHLRSIPKH